MEQTKNLHLWLPSDTDPLEVEKLSENFKSLDNFAQLADSFKVGDILTTLRTDLGDDWLLCNGEPFDTQKYPGLAAVLPDVTAAENAGEVSSGAMSSVPAKSYASFHATDGKTQVVTTASSISTTEQVNYAIWSSDDFKTVTRVSIGLCRHAKPFYCNGQWILFAFNIDTSTSPYRLAGIYATSATHASFGKAVSPPNGIIIRNVMGVEYVDGKYYAFAHVDNRCVVLVSDDPSFSGCSVTSVNAANNKGPYAHYCKVGDKYVFVRFSNTALYDVSWSDSPDSGYQTRTLETQNNGITVASPTFLNMMIFGKPAHRDGKLFWPANEAGSSTKAALICLDGIESGDVRYISLSSFGTGMYAATILDTPDESLACFTYTSGANSAYTVYLMISNGDPTNADNWRKIPLATVGATITEKNVPFLSNTAIGTFMLDNKTIFTPRFGIPKISISGCYAYIKAK